MHISLGLAQALGFVSWLLWCVETAFQSKIRLQETSEVVHVCFKEKDLTPKRLLIDVRWPQEPAAFEQPLGSCEKRR